MASAIPQGKLAEIVPAARSRTGVPAVAAGLSVDGTVELAADGPCDVDTPFRVASITKWFTASLAAKSVGLEPELRRLLSHTADLRPGSGEPLPGACRGLWSYANAGYWAAGDAIAAATGLSYSDAMREQVLEPLQLDATSFEEPAEAAPGHLQDGESGHRLAPPSEYPVSRRPSGGLWSTVADLLRFAEKQLDDPDGLQQPQAEALGAEYCLGCWRRELAGGRVAFDHEGSVAGYQSLLLLVPAERAALAVLTNSWRGSGLIRRVVQALGLVPASDNLSLAQTGPVQPGRYALDGDEATVALQHGGLRIGGSSLDPVSGQRIEQPPLSVTPLGGGVYGMAGGLLMSHRADFPRPRVARIGWVALPRAGS
ncbi:MAG TPA: serine hydrolase domain-containing protein [Gaiellaceae bacterium]|nr:serine hydrolase domain-containing protein [Gaiellaceae bacterium]